MQIEKDKAEILSGVRHGVTLGSPIALLVVNRDWSTGKGPDGVPWMDEMNVSSSEVPFETITHIRPGHADTPGVVKYMQSDARNILERSSAREFAARVAAGAVAKRFLEEFGIAVHGHVLSIGGIHAKYPEYFDWDKLEEAPYHKDNIDGSKMAAVRCADLSASELMIKEIDSARDAGDSLGGRIEIIATGVPIGLGSHIQWDRKLTTKLAAAVMSMNAVKGVEFGAGFSQVDLRGSQVHDVVKPIDEWQYDSDEQTVRPWQRRSNNSGGLEGGMSTGEPLLIRAAVKPIATIISGLETVNLLTGEFVEKAHFERSDITFVPSCAVVGEAMVALVVADAMLEKFGGDNIEETRRNWIAYIATTFPKGI